MLLPFRDDNPISRTPVVTVGLVILNTVVFLAVNRLDPLQRQETVLRYGFVPARVATLGNHQPLVVQTSFLGQTPWGLQQADHELVLAPSPGEIAWSLLTCMFLHGGWMHLIGNMWFLWIFGDNVEDRLGPLVFLMFYLVGGLLGTAAYWLMDPQSQTPVIGASGAVATVLGAYAITWPWARVQTLVFLFVFITVIDLPALLVLGGWFLGQLLEGTQALHGAAHGLTYNTGIAWWAHIGGFVAGAALMPPLAFLVQLLRQERPEEPLDAILID